MFLLLKKRKFFEKTWFGWSLREALSWNRVRRYLKFGLPAAGMIIFEVVGFQFATIFVAFLNDELVLAAHNTVMSILFMAFYIPLGIGVAATTRVGNLLGEQRRDEASFSSYMSQATAGVCAFVTATTVIAGRHVIPYILTSDEKIVAIASEILVFMAILHLADAYQGVGNSVVRACGRQNFGFVVCLIGY